MNEDLIKELEVKLTNTFSLFLLENGIENANITVNLVSNDGWSNAIITDTPIIM